MNRIWVADAPIKGIAQASLSAFAGYMWATFVCTTCGGVVTAKSKGLHRDPKRGQFLNPHHASIVEDLYPPVPAVDAAIPERASAYLRQAIETLHAPDGAAMLAASAVDAMLKAKGYSEGTLNARIKKAVEEHTITQDMGEWAHRIRLDANDVRHSDEKALHKTEQEARQLVEFAKALGTFMFVIPARVKQGIEDTEDAPSVAESS